MRSRATKLAVAATSVLLVIAAGSGRFLKLDADIAVWIRSNAPGAGNTDAALRLTTLGSTPVAVGVLVLAGMTFAIKRWWADLVFLVISVVGGVLVNPPLKDFFDRPRPFSESQTITFAGTSFPSGHAMTVTVLCGALLMIGFPRLTRPRARAWAVTAAVAIVGVVAATRIFLGAHYLTDVLGGIAFGLLWLAICDAAVRAVVRRPRV